ncbi:MAG TPA: MBL fold metallo-hydrolase, partial [Paracoccaceae bacterium]|nr:MBL fold metallo-hydrolase [Paracoccaceae bacterium]
EGIDPDFRPDVLLRDGDQISGSSWTLTALHTPGHLSNHLCFAWEGRDAIFSGDHVMGWATTLISPPDGDLTAFMASLRRLQDRPEDFYYPGHGAGIFDAHGMLDYQLGHRLGREDQILAELGKGPRDILAITSVIYADIDKRLHGAASRNVLAHIVDLYERGLVAPQGVFSANTTFGLV